MKKTIISLFAISIVVVLTSCMGAKSSSSSGRGGELVGVGGRAFTEPTPYGMTRIERGFLKMGLLKQDTLWGKQTPVKEISVDGFWMDETEITNSQYKQFVNWVRDSILRTRLADPNYGGDETYMITEDKNGDPVTPHLDWNKRLPRKPSEDELRAIESLYTTNPVTGEKLLDYSQLNYKYEVYDYTAAALRRNRLNPAERNLNTDITINPNEVVMISKDTAYIDDEGRIVRETINRPLSGPWDFLNTYIVNIYPDTTCWVNDFRNSDNEVYLRNYFSNPAYNDYPVVGVTWEQANAFCAWRTDYLLKGLGGEARYIQRYRLPTEAEWEYAARGGNKSRGYKYAGSDSINDVAWYDMNGEEITHPVASKLPNELGIYDMTGNVYEWCSDWYGIYTDEPQTNPHGPTTGPGRIIRGGSIDDLRDACTSTSRDNDDPNDCDSDMGLRLAL